jgi:hypothetical protein
VASAAEAATAYVSPGFPGLHLDFAHVFQLSVLHEPSEVSLLLLASSDGTSWGSDCLVATLAAPLPGQHSSHLGGSWGRLISYDLLMKFPCLKSFTIDLHM